MEVKRPLVIIVSPALPSANNGNWQTAWRWSRMLAANYRSRIVQHWPAPQVDPADLPVAMLALHARRSASAIQAWADAYPLRGLAVVLTGTDLYRDIQTDAAAQRSLQLAQRLVLLQERGPDALPAAWRTKARVIFQSCTQRQPLEKSTRQLRAVVVGHLREEKSPQTVFEAARALAGRGDIHIDHIGQALDPVLGDLAQQTAAACPGYRWLGGLTHEATRRRIQRAHVLIHSSRMEGGAHVLMEAVCSGTPVLASRIPGNVGMLGADYGGYFEWGDSAALARLLMRCRDEPGFISALRAQCRQRAPLFDPVHERAALLDLIRDVTESP
jgi:putative glycosyltransferase (TIGR04348 family)